MVRPMGRTGELLAAARGWAVAAAVATAGCGPADAPCGPCPDLSGRWALQLQAPLSPCGGSTPPAVLELTQVAATLTAQLDGGTASGTLYDSSRFSLHGTLAGGGEARDSLLVRALYLEGLSDGGMARLVEGNWTWTSAATGCTEGWRFTAQRQ
jgi:hypothetical protein